MKLEIQLDELTVRQIFGSLDENCKLIEKEMNVKLSQAGEGISVDGEGLNVEATNRLLNILDEKVQAGDLIDEQGIRYNINLILSGRDKNLSKDLLDDVVCLTANGKPVRPKTLGQKKYLDEIDQNDIVFGIGPAGTGKTFLAMTKAVDAFMNKEVSRIILTRPAVEAGESLGFLPGDLQEKIDPYLRPLYDALFKILGYETYEKLIERGSIEVAPLAYMRGRTLDDSYVILDEAQNTTYEQMKMFLTRIGYGSKAIVTGDITQIDLPAGKKSGLKLARDILADVDGISFVELGKHDIVRHPLVMKIIGAYEKFEKKNESGNRQ